MVSVRLITSGCTMAVSRGALSLLKCRIGKMLLDRYATRWGEFCSRGPFIGPRDASSRPDTRTGQSQGTSGQGRKIVSNLNDCRLKSSRLRSDRLTHGGRSHHGPNEDRASLVSWFGRCSCDPCAATIRANIQPTAHGSCGVRVPDSSGPRRLEVAAVVSPRERRHTGTASRAGVVPGPPEGGRYVPRVA